MTPLVSVIMPAWNAERFIGETIESVQAQTYTAWELLITDDGSTDATAEVIRGYARRDPRIRLFRFPRNTGLAARARNYSLSRAAGEYLAFLDADDLWHPEKLAKQVAHLEANPEADAVCTWYTVFGDPARAEQWRRMMWRYDSPTLNEEQILNQTPATPTVMLRRRCYQALGPMEVNRRLATGEDRQYFVRLVLAHRMDRLCEELVHVRVHPEGGSLSTVAVERKRERDWEIYRTLRRRGVLKGTFEKKFRAQFFYNQAKDSLFHFRRPFRADLWRAVLTGHAPTKALVMAALSWMPAPLLRQTLEALLRLRNPRSR